MNFLASKEYNRLTDSIRNRWNIWSINVFSHKTLFYLGQKIILVGTDGTMKEKRREEGSRLSQLSKNLEDRGRPLQDVAHHLPFAKPRFYRSRVIKGSKERRMQEDKKARRGRDERGRAKKAC